MPPSQPYEFRCIACGRTGDSPRSDFRCEPCGDLLEITYPGWIDPARSGMRPAELERTWRKRRLSGRAVDRSGVWRFREMLPVLRNVSSVVTLQEGNTPFYELPRCARSAGVERLLAKHQGMNPTGSFKDRGMTVAISVARENGFKWVACASTGNTSASMAAYAARAGMNSLVLIPEGKIAWSKLAQALEYGALTCQLRTDFDGCVRVLGEIIQRLPVYLVNSVNPFRLEGQKTGAISLLEQLEWKVPDHVILPGGNLANSSAFGKGFAELKQLGFTQRVPKISIIQASGANPLVRSMRENDGRSLMPVKAETLATAIRIGNPASWKKAVNTLTVSGGRCEEVSEAEIAIAKAEIGADGIGCEPASAATLAGLKKLVASGFVRRDDSVVLVLTGHVLKDPEYSLNFHRGELPFANESAVAKHRRPPLVLEANADEVLRALQEHSQREKS